MTRWIVAGVLLAVLVLVIVTEEAGVMPTATPTAGPSAGGPDSLQAAAEAPPPDPIGEVKEGVNDTLPADTDEIIRKPAFEACQPIIQTLEAVGGTTYMDKVGTALYEQKALKPAQVTALCKELEGKPQDQIVARMAEVTGVRP